MREHSAKRGVRGAAPPPTPPPRIESGAGSRRGEGEGGGAGYVALRSSRGFTLLEVIVALAILGVGFALAMELLATGVRSAKASEDYTQAVLLARQKMAEVSVARNLTGSADTGEFGGGFRWASEAQPLEQQEELPGRLYSVRVRVSWLSRRGEKSVDLQTLRMAVDEKKLGQTYAASPSGR